MSQTASTQSLKNKLNGNSNPLSITIQSNGNDLQLTSQDIKQYLCPNATDKEIRQFLELCRAQNLNPWMREAYLIKYSEHAAASMVVGKEVFTKRAEQNEDYEGFKAGVIVQKDDELLYREGSLTLSNEKLVGGWAEVYRTGKKPFRNEVSFEEYVGKKKNGEVNGQWLSKPATMIRKVPLVQSLREAYPNVFQGMYDAAEINTVHGELSEEPINVTPTATTEQKEAKEVEIVETEATEAVEPSDIELMRQWAEKQDDISILSERFNDLQKDEPETAEVIMERIKKLQGASNG